MITITENSFYSFTTEALIVTLCLVTIGFFFGHKLEKTSFYKPYIVSRRLMGTVTLLYLTMNLWLKLFDYRDTNPITASALNIACYYAGAILCYYALTVLLNPNLFHNRKSIRNDIIRYAGFIVWLFIAVVFISTKWAYIMLIAAAVYFTIDVVRVTVLFFREYHKAVRNINEFYSDFIEGYVQWMYNGVVLIIISGLIGGISIFTSKWGIGVYSLLGVGVFFYVLMCYTNYLMHIREVSAAIETETDNETDSSIAETGNDLPTTLTNNAAIAKNIQEWIDRKGFLQAGITIVELSNQLKTNRTYSSAYINNVYNCSFRDFICQLRIGYSKQLLSDTNLSMTEIAEQTGFSSVSSFSRAFAQHEKCSPTTWRNRHLN
ncbi:MAG: AraC family transcriptional regulator [Paludibacteraceae bacterium]|nr:AraC family transcriptional regulator [Paludibacteraceae bacterium]